jgi:hypothetical protein
LGFNRFRVGLGLAILANFAAMQNDPTRNVQREVPDLAASDDATAGAPASPQCGPVEHGGPPGPEPTRFGDWEKNGRCIDF